MESCQDFNAIDSYRFLDSDRDSQVFPGEIKSFFEANTEDRVKWDDNTI